MGGAGTDHDPCTSITGTCSTFDVIGYSPSNSDCSNMDENGLCVTQCASDYYATSDGVEVTFDFRCVCTGDRSSAASLTCGFELERSSPVENAQCITCAIEPQTTWFGQATNNVKVKGPNGGLVTSRVQSNHLIQSDWSEYSVLVMLPGDWSQARIFTWIYDVDVSIVESDATSTLVVLRQNGNSPVLELNEWAEFFIGFDNIAEYITDGSWDTYRIGIVPGSPSSDELICLTEILAQQPAESPERVERRKVRQEKLADMWGENHEHDRPRWNQKYQIKKSKSTSRGRSMWSTVVDETVDLIARFV